MARPPIELDVKMSDVLRDNLREKRFLFSPVRKDLIERVSKLAHTTAQRAAKPHAQDKGTLGRKILLEISEDGLVARIDMARSVAGIAFTIEYGRRPGRRPPYKAIKRWAEGHGFVPIGRGNSKFVQVIREEIKAKGTRGVFFMSQAREVAQIGLREGLPHTAREIRAMWERGG